MDTIVNLLNTLGPLVGMLTGTGLLVKYLPWMKWFPNDAIKMLNALIVFFGFLGGTAGVAHAGVFGEAAQQLGLLGKIAGSFVLSGIASWFYEAHLRTPIEKLGIKKPV